MKVQYLYCSTFTCPECDGLLISGFVATRETEDQKKTVFRQIGPGCMSCGRQYDSLIPSRTVRCIVPFEWGIGDSADKKTTSIPLEDSVGEQHVQQRTIDVNSAAIAVASAQPDAL